MGNTEEGHVSTLLEILACTAGATQPELHRGAVSTLLEILGASYSAKNH